VAKTVYDVLKEKIEEHRSSAIEMLSAGSATDYAKYRELCGLIRGLETALREVYDLAKHQMELDDD
jgi:hypothetical protein